MPWFPDFVGAVELARRQTRAEGRADPVGQYLTALSRGDTGAVEDVWPGDVVVHDPRAGEVRGHGARFGNWQPCARPFAVRLTGPSMSRHPAGMP